MIPLVKIKLIFLLSIFLSSCFGPVKELKYQIEDSMEDRSIYVSNPNPLNELDNKLFINVEETSSFDDDTLRNFKIFSKGDLIYYISQSGLINSFNLKTNKLKNIYKNSINISSGINGDDEFLYYVDVRGYLTCYSIPNGLNWKSFVGEVYSPPEVSDGKIFVKDTNNKFYALNAKDGSLIWTYQLPSPSLSIRSWAPMTISEGILYSGGPSGKIIAINSNNGTLLWETTFSQPKGSSEIQRSNDVTSSLIMDDFQLFVVSSQGNVASIAKEDGSILWSRQLSSFEGMSQSEDKIFITHSSGSIYSLSKDTNKVIWRNANYLGRDVSKPIRYKDYIIFSDYEGWMHVISLEGGDDLARVKISSSTLLTPLIIDDKIFIVSIDGTFSLLTISLNNEKDIDHNTNKTKVSNENLDIETNENSEGDKTLIDTLIFWD